MFKLPLRARRRVGRSRGERRFEVESLESRTLLTTASTPWLIQLQSAETSLPLAIVPEPGGIRLRGTTVPGLIEATGDAASLTSLMASLADRPGVRYVAPVRTLSVSAEPNDTYYQSGQLTGLNGPKGIQAPQAWNVTTGSTAVPVASIDTGIEYTHPDLYLNIWVNQREIPPSRLANLSDTDGDARITLYDLNNPLNQGTGKITDLNGNGRIDGGDLIAPMTKDSAGRDTGLGGWSDGVSPDGDNTYIDDLIGWNFVTDTNDPLDDNGHGTHTAGILGAIGNNNLGVVGVQWKASMMALKFIAGNGFGTDLGAAEAIRYAADHGARVSNNSYGDNEFSAPMSDAIGYAAGLGHLVVAAAGNSASNTDVSPFYPASDPHPNVIAVASIDADTGALSSFSSYGRTTVHLGAPGGSSLSTARNGTYGWGGGTSYASPHVAGAAALVMAAHPGWTSAQVRAQLLATVTPSPSLAGKTVSGGILNVGAAVGTPSSTATFVTTDTTTKGSWRGAYGSQSYAIAGDATTMTGLTFSGQSSYVWSGSTTSPRATQKAPPAAANDRIEAGWYSFGAFTADLNITDGQTHQLAAYFADWDGYGGGRQQKIDLIDPANGNVLDSRNLSNFGGGVHLVWNVSGPVRLRVSNTNPNSNAVLSALFLDPTGVPAPAAPTGVVATGGTNRIDLTWNPSPNALAYRIERAGAGTGFTEIGTTPAGVTSFADLNLAASATFSYRISASNNAGVSAYSNTVTATTRSASASSATFVTTNTTTQGTWRGTYGSQSYAIAGDATTMTGLTFSGQSSYVWTASTTSPRATQKAPPAAANDRIEAGWYSFGAFTADLDITDGQTHQLAAYFADWDGYGGGRSERIDLIDPATGNVLDSRNLSNFGGGVHLVWNVSGRVRIRVVNTNPNSNAVLSALFLDPAGVAAPAAPTGLTATGGTNQVDLSWTASATATGYRVERSTGGGAFAEVGTTGAGVTTYRDSSLASGTTYSYRVRAFNGGGTSAYSNTANATTASGPSVAFVTTDTATKGTWRGTYGSQSYAIAGDATTMTGLTFSGQSAYVWTASTTSPRATQKAPPAAATDRIEAGWYSFSTFTADLSITDGQTHQLAAYFADWDGYGGGRSERIDLIDPATGVVLDSRSLSNFGGGVHLVWNVSGSVRIRVVNTNPNSNAVLSALFLDPAGVAAPAAPTGLTATGGTNQVDLSWTASATATGYRVERSTGGGAFAEVGTTGAGVTTYRDSGLASGTTYSYRVRAFNGGGTSPYSNTANATTASGPTATFVRTDTTTLGTWRGAYGSQSYALAGDAATMTGLTLSGQTSYVWTASTASPRGTQKAPPAPATDRFEGAWYSFSTFNADLNITDGQVHQLAAYFADWDGYGGGRQQTIDLIDPATGNVLDSRSLSNFGGGVHLVWNVSGRVRIRVSNTNPNSNAVLSALFLDPKP